MIHGTIHVTGYFCLFVAIAMMAPMAADLSMGNSDWLAFLASALLVGTLSGLMILSTRGRVPPFSPRFGFLLVNALWLSTSLVAAVPFLLADQNIGFTDAVFEAVSAITTTGSTVLAGLDSLPPGLLLWRSLTQWIGGLGIIAMSLLLLPFLRVGGMQIFRMESSTRSENPFPRFAELSRALLIYYLLASVLCALAYFAVGMTPFDAVNHAMTTISTGGFSTRDSSMGDFGAGAKVVGIIFMIAGALPFIAIVRALVTGRTRDFYDPQIPVLLGLLLGFSLAITLGSLAAADGDVATLALDAAFNVTSVVTTTGFASADYTLWGPFAVAAFFVATFLGGAAGSTSGGFKTYRLIILFKTIKLSLRELIFPHGVFIVRYENLEVSRETLRQISTFLAAFIALLMIGTLGLAALGLDLVTALTGTLTALTNVGPGLGDIIGPAGNFSTLPDAAKWILSGAMLLGRLEILTVLVLLSPDLWRR